MSAQTRLARSILTGVAIFCLGLIFYLGAFGRRWAGEQWDVVKHALSSQARDERRLARIRRELDEAPVQSWAGEYSYATGFDGSSLAVAPNSGYFYDQSYDFPSDNSASGALTQDADTLLLRGAPESVREMVIVPWGRRTYLIAKRRLNDFVNAVNDGDEPRYGWRGRFYLRDGDERFDAEGGPLLPPEWRKRLRSKPLSARIVAIGVVRHRSLAGTARRILPVTLDVGDDQGVFVEERFLGRAYFPRVQHVYRSSSIAEVDLTGGWGPPKIGERLSTRDSGVHQYSVKNPPYRWSLERLGASALPCRSARLLSSDDPKYLAAARARGFAVRPILRGTLLPLDGTFMDMRPGRSPDLEALVAAAGANAYSWDLASSCAHDPCPTIVKGWRVEWKGRPLESDQFPWKAAGWRWVPSKILLDANPIQRAEQMAFDDAYRRLLHLTREQFSDLMNLRLERLTAEQRQALEELEGVRERKGRFGDVFHANYKDPNWNRGHDLAAQAVVPVSMRLRALNPRAYRAYERLREESRKTRLTSAP